MINTLHRNSNRNAILSARDLGIEQAVSGADFDPPIWIRQSPLFMTAYTRGYHAASAARRIGQ